MSVVPQTNQSFAGSFLVQDRHVASHGQTHALPSEEWAAQLQHPSDGNLPPHSAHLSTVSGQGQWPSREGPGAEINRPKLGLQTIRLTAHMGESAKHGNLWC